MEVKDLQPKQGNVEVELEIVEKEEPRTFSKFGKEGRVCNAKAKDSSGEIKLTLWNEQIDQVKVGDKVKIENGYVNEWQGEMQLTTGKFGKLEVVGAAAEESQEATTETTESETLNAEEQPATDAAKETEAPKPEETPVEEKELTTEESEQPIEEPIVEEEKIE